MPKTSLSSLNVQFTPWVSGITTIVEEKIWFFGVKLDQNWPNSGIWIWYRNAPHSSRLAANWVTQKSFWSIQLQVKWILRLNFWLWGHFGDLMDALFSFQVLKMHYFLGLQSLVWPQKYKRISPILSLMAKGGSWRVLQAFKVWFWVCWENLWAFDNTPCMT